MKLASAIKAGQPGQFGWFGSTGLAVLLLVVGIPAALLGGSSFQLGLAELNEALFGDARSLAAQLILTVRLPRVLVAALVGAALAVAGALMQGMTRNPLASPGLFGINAGAACLLVLVQSGLLTGLTGLAGLSELPLLLVTGSGAALAGALVLLLGGGWCRPIHPVRLVLAGVAVSALLTALTRTLLIVDEQAQQVLDWLAGSVAETGWQQWHQLWPGVLLGLLAALLLAQPLNLLALGDEASAGLGQSPQRLRLQVALVVILLAASAVAVAGPVAFVGLLVPHLCRGLAGGDHRRLLPLAALFGAALMVWADLISRLLVFPSETPVGIVTALIGAPGFLWLTCRGRGGLV
ncbi:FecCD family ABC transporter permease [Marinobacterium arenosum]|uniref:FecCD family ABC transporter permease n=1 Tax=Marinobacterium arenosum TaxID=2862496 RepID=UPI001C988BA1|nr:iron chelate uptake ABC transporter family permease subunit [Marinobacterium arenosum]MBY4677355.1 iron chelate uptake ABC transporter family permease subunit [Marinobacterium arenosum]